MVNSWFGGLGPGGFRFEAGIPRTFLGIPNIETTGSQTTFFTITRGKLRGKVMRIPKVNLQCLQLKLSGAYISRWEATQLLQQIAIIHQ